MIKRIITYIKSYINRYREAVTNLIRGCFSPQLALTYIIPLKFWPILYPRLVILPENIKVIVNHPATLYVNVYDEFVLREYSKLPEYLPSRYDIVFDVGSYVGLYALRAAKKVGDKGFVIACEPNPYCFYFLLQNININNIHNIIAFPVALSNKNDYLDFYIIKSGNIGASSFHYAHVKKWAKEIKRIRVPSMTLDYFIRNLYVKLNMDRIDILKIDAEGAEADILQGGKNTLTKGMVDKIIIEVHEDINPLEYILKMLLEYGFRVNLYI